MKRQLLFLLFMAIAVGVQAQNTLNVIQKDGTITCYAFADKPQTMFSGSDVIVKTDKTEVAFAFSSIEKYTFEDGLTPTGVLSTRFNGKAYPVKIYTPAGALVKTIEPSAEGMAEAQINALPAGTYIINNGTTTYKINKK